MNTFGTHLRVTTFGESHGRALGCIIDGLPAGLEVDLEDVQHALDRRRPGQSRLTTPRRESDRVEALAGLLDGRTTGAPLALAVFNHDVDSTKYEDMKDLYRPSHADYTYEAKYGMRDWRGGGRASARETVARVAAGAVAEQVLARAWGIEIVAWVSELATLTSAVDEATVDRAQVDGQALRCPDASAAERMTSLLDEARRERDSLGGCIRCVARNVPAGWGEPVFGKLDGELARAMLSIPAAKAFESGSGFEGTTLRGSQHNDAFFMEEGRVRTRTNRSGGIQGGISNGETLRFRVGFKPVATLFQPQETVRRSGEAVQYAARGRHDPCVLPRAVPIVEAMCALVLLDLSLAQLGRDALERALGLR